jgi:hypothetical protein
MTDGNVLFPELIFLHPIKSGLFDLNLMLIN